MFEKFLSKGLAATKAVADAVADATQIAAEAVGDAVIGAENAAAERTTPFIPGAVRAAALLVMVRPAPEEPPSLHMRAVAKAILIDVGITCKADLINAKKFARPVDCDACMVIFQ